MSLRMSPSQSNICLGISDTGSATALSTAAHFNVEGKRNYDLTKQVGSPQAIAIDEVSAVRAPRIGY
jgi:hypothetical protein